MFPQLLPCRAGFEGEARMPPPLKGRLPANAASPVAGRRCELLSILPCPPGPPELQGSSHIHGMHILHPAHVGCFMAPNRLLRPDKTHGETLRAAAEINADVFTLGHGLLQCLLATENHWIGIPLYN